MVVPSNPWAIGSVRYRSIGSGKNDLLASGAGRRHLAKSQEGLAELTDEHWAIVNFIRNHYLETNLAPMVRSICKATGLPLRRIYELFPSGPAKGACKVAGLPKPDGCV